MKSNLEPTKNVLRNFLEELENIKVLRKNISAPQPVLAFTVEDRQLGEAGDGFESFDQIR